MKDALPDGNNLAEVQAIVRRLCNEDGSNGFIKSSTVHVNSGANRENEPRDAFVKPVVFFDTSECHR